MPVVHSVYSPIYISLCTWGHFLGCGPCRNLTMTRNLLDSSGSNHRTIQQPQNDLATTERPYDLWHTNDLWHQPTSTYICHILGRGPIGPEVWTWGQREQPVGLSVAYLLAYVGLPVTVECDNSVTFSDYSVTMHDITLFISLSPSCRSGEVDKGHLYSAHEFAKFCSWRLLFSIYYIIIYIITPIVFSFAIFLPIVPFLLDFVLYFFSISLLSHKWHFVLLAFVMCCAII